MARLNYVELPAAALAPTRAFYEQAFGWQLSQFGSSYAATVTGDTDVGLQGDASEAPAAPLAVLEVENLEAAPAAVENADGRIVRPIFAFPGGRRFHFATLAATNWPVSKARADGVAARGKGLALATGAARELDCVGQADANRRIIPPKGGGRAGLRR
jgi:predicted enzyme related to lactoylglutathione lyase